MILLCFKEIILGELNFKNNKIFYTSYEESEQQLKQKYPVIILYDLFNSNNKELEVLPDFLKDLYDMTENDFYKQLATINENDDMKTKFKKIANLNLSKEGFYIINKSN